MNRFALALPAVFVSFVLSLFFPKKSCLVHRALEAEPLILPPAQLSCRQWEAKTMPVLLAVSVLLALVKRAALGLREPVVLVAAASPATTPKGLRPHLVAAVLLDTDMAPGGPVLDLATQGALDSVMVHMGFDTVGPVLLAPPSSHLSLGMRLYCNLSIWNSTLQPKQ